VKFTRRYVDERALRDRALARLERETGLPIRIAYLGLQGVADRAGRFEWRPEEIKHATLPTDDVEFRDVLDALAGALYVVKYIVGGRGYGWWPGIAHAVGINAKEAASVLPPPPPNVVAWYETAIMARDMGQPFDVPNPLVDAPTVRATPNGHAAATEARSHSANGASPPTSLNGNELHDRSRVAHASSTGKAPEEDPTGSRPDAPFVLALKEREREIREQLETLGSETGGATHALAPGSRAAVLAGGEGGRARALPAIRGDGRRDVEAIIRRFATVLDEVATGRRDTITREQWRRIAAELVFAYWAKSFKKDNSYLVDNDKREAKILARMHENGDDISELCYALDGVKRSTYHMGANDTRTVYDGIETILRDRQQVEKFAGMMPAYRDKKVHPMRSWARARPSGCAAC
jgi:hypothetical protein